MSDQEHKLLMDRIKLILSGYQHYIWNDLSKILCLVWKYEIESMMEMDPKLLSAEGFLNGLWREKVTPAEDIYEVFKELQLINGNNKSLTLNMDTEKKVPQRVPVLAHLKQHGTLTGSEAWRLYGIYRLSSVIKRLRISGQNIVTHIVGEERYGKYELIKS